MGLSVPTCQKSGRLALCCHTGTILAWQPILVCGLRQWSEWPARRPGARQAAQPQAVAETSVVKDAAAPPCEKLHGVAAYRPPAVLFVGGCSGLTGSAGLSDAPALLARGFALC